MKLVLSVPSGYSVFLSKSKSTWWPHCIISGTSTQVVKDVVFEQESENWQNSEEERMKLCAASLSDAKIFIPSEILVLETEIIVFGFPSPRCLQFYCCVSNLLGLLMWLAFNEYFAFFCLTLTLIFWNVFCLSCSLYYVDSLTDNLGICVPCIVYRCTGWLKFRCFPESITLCYNDMIFKKHCQRPFLF